MGYASLAFGFGCCRRVDIIYRGGDGGVFFGEFLQGFGVPQSCLLLGSPDMVV